MNEKWKVAIAFVPLLFLLTLVSTAWANGEHHGQVGAPPAIGFGPLAWTVVGLTVAMLLAVGVMLFFLRKEGERWEKVPRLADQKLSYLERIKGFSRNAQLLLARGLLVGLNFGLWAVLFNLYLLSMGFDKLFVAQMVSANWLAHGLMVIPAGIISDLLGRRITFLWAYSLATCFRAAMVFTLDPTSLILLNILAGGAEGFHAITGPPFMAEQSRKEERVHLFSFFAGAVGISMTLGSLLAGFLPVVFADSLKLPQESSWALRLALACAIPLGIISMVPIYMIKEKWQRRSLKSWFVGLRSTAVIGMFALTTAISGVALGFTTPFFNVLFADKYRAGPEHVGLVFSLGTVAVALSTALAPLLVQRMGRVRTIVLVQVLGLPFLLAMVFSPTFTFVGSFYVLRGIFSGTAAGPGGGLAAPISNLFSMEVVEESERGTTNGVIHAMSEFPMSLGAYMAGPMMQRGDWASPYYFAAILFFISFALFMAYFLRIEKAKGLMAVRTS